MKPYGREGILCERRQLVSFASLLDFPKVSNDLPLVLNTLIWKQNKPGGGSSQNLFLVYKHTHAHTIHTAVIDSARILVALSQTAAGPITQSTHALI
jgi:hypothetical protein